MQRIGRRRFRRSRRRSRRLRSKLNLREVHADPVFQKAHDMRSGLPFVREFRGASTKLRGRTAAAMRWLFDPTRDNALVEAFAMVRSCQDTSWPWIHRKRPAPPNSCPMGRSLSTTTRAANTLRAVKLVELKTTYLDDTGLIADETEQHVSDVIAPAVVN